MKNHRDNGFTLIEMLITMLLISISILGVTVLMTGLNEHFHRQFMIRTMDQYGNDALEWLSKEVANADSVTVYNQRLDLYKTNLYSRQRTIDKFRYTASRFKVDNDYLWDTNFEKLTKDPRDRVYIQKVTYELSHDKKLLQISINMQYYRNSKICYERTYETIVFIRNYRI